MDELSEGDELSVAGAQTPALPLAAVLHQRGYFGGLANHAAMVTGLGEGALKVRAAEGKPLAWQVSGGFFEVSHNKATVLADSVSG
jgi:F0F1-type ATP synthase epsilon subunit